MPWRAFQRQHSSLVAPALGFPFTTANASSANGWDSLLPRDSQPTLPTVSCPAAKDDDSAFTSDRISSHSPLLWEGLSWNDIHDVTLDKPLQSIESLLSLEPQLEHGLQGSQDIMDFSIDSLDALAGGAMSPLCLDLPLPPPFLFCDDLLSLDVPSPPPAPTPASVSAPAAPALAASHTKVSDKGLRKRARKGRGRYRQRPRACELPAEELKHQRKLARNAATRRRAHWLEEQAVLAGAMAASARRAEELASEQDQLQKELTILRDVVFARFGQP